MTYSSSELEAMTVAKIRDTAAITGYCISGNKKDELIKSFLKEQEVQSDN